MHDEVLLPAARKLLPKLGRTIEGQGWYLAGGTALALQYGHRRSVDFDWFRPTSFSLEPLKRRLQGLGKLTVVSEATGTFHGRLAGVRLSFLHYPYRLLWPTISYGGVRLADPRDIAGMKLHAVSNRGSKKDFFDLYRLLQHYSLEQLLSWFDRKYRGVRYNRLHLLKSLVYFANAEPEPNPFVLHSLSWTAVKREVRKRVVDYLRMK